MRKILPALAVICSGTAMLQGQTARITGHVTDSKGKTLAGVSVSASVQRLEPPPKEATALVGSILPYPAKARTAADGAFEIDGLPDGTYSLCADGVAIEVLNPCIWAAKNAPVKISAGKPTDVSLAVSTGVTFLVRVDDSQALLLGTPSADDVRVGTHYGAFRFIPARRIQQDLTGKTLGLIVPASTQLEVLIRSDSFVLANAKGNRLAGPSAAIAVMSPAVSPTAANADLGKAAPHLAVQVAGKVAGKP